MRHILIAALVLSFAAAPAFAGQTIHIGGSANGSSYGDGYNNDQSESPWQAKLAYWQDRYERDRDDQQACSEINAIQSQYGISGRPCVFGELSSPRGFGNYGNGNIDQSFIAGAAGGVVGSIAVGIINQLNQPREERRDTRQEIPDYVSSEKLVGCYQTDQGWYRCKNSDQTFDRRHGKFVPHRD